MTITGIERNNRRRSRVDLYINGVVACDISRVTAKKRDLRIGSELSEAELAALIAEDRKREAMETAAAMLARRPHSEREVRRRLTQRKLDEPVIEATLARLKDVRLLDDTEFARSFAESRGRRSPRSKRLLVQELRAVGVDATVAASAVADVSDVDAAYELAQTRVRSLARLEEQAFRQRLSGLLQRRGFGWDVTRSTVDRCWLEASEGHSV